MQWILVGLGNPGAEYKGSRHNIGKDFLEALAPQLPKNAKVASLDVYMNNSGVAIRKLVSSKKQLSQLVVLHDELDLPLGSVKISFGSGSGGHRGAESIIKALKTKEFVRIRIGISPATAAGKLKKPDQGRVVDFVLSTFKQSEEPKLKAARKKVAEALELLLNEGLPRAMTEINSR
jgi:PTH1 family peptidyl-tRNA hydrolase